MYGMPVYGDPLGTHPVELGGRAVAAAAASEAPPDSLYVVQVPGRAWREFHFVCFCVPAVRP